MCLLELAAGKEGGWVVAWVEDWEAGAVVARAAGREADAVEALAVGWEEATAVGQEVA